MHAILLASFLCAAGPDDDARAALAIAAQKPPQAPPVPKPPVAPPVEPVWPKGDYAWRVGGREGESALYRGEEQVGGYSHRSRLFWPIVGGEWGEPCAPPIPPPAAPVRAPVPPPPQVYAPPPMMPPMMMGGFGGGGRGGSC